MASSVQNANCATGRKISQYDQRFAKLQFVASYFNMLNFINYESNVHENADMHQLSFSSSILVGQQFTPEGKNVYGATVPRKKRERVVRVELYS
jgi:hypothetical protein